MKNIFLLSLVISIFLIPTITFGQEKIDNAGFLPGNIWYSKDPFFAGDKIEIHTIVFNSSDGILTGTLDFYDGDTKIGSSAINVPAGGRFQEIAINWTVTEGYHKIFGVISSPKITRKGTSLAITLDNSKTDESEKFISGPVNYQSATSTAIKYLSDKTMLAKEYAENNLPEPVTEVASSVGSLLENVREGGKVWSDSKGVDINDKIKKINKDALVGVSDTKQNAFVSKTEKPLQYIYAFLVDIASLFFGSKWAFYFGLILVLFFIIRFIKRIFFF